MAPKAKDAISTASPADFAESSWLGIWRRGALVLVLVSMSKVQVRGVYNGSLNYPRGRHELFEQVSLEKVC